MYWKLCFEKAAPSPAGVPAGNRFVVHRHRDAWGEHLDVRVELDGFLMGWRVEADSLEGVCWATEKAPHPVDWLDDDRGAVRVDSGTYVRCEDGAEGRVLLLHGQHGTYRLRAERGQFIPAAAACALEEVMAARHVGAEDVGRLVDDGVTARERAVRRFCGLGHELDEAAFDEVSWRHILAGMPLEEIHRQLRGFEIRFDRKYPPSPVSQPERLPEERGGEADSGVLAILQE